MTPLPEASSASPEAPPAPPKTKTVTRSKAKTKTLEETERQVTVHCRYQTIPASWIRIWKTTYLIDQATGHRSPLLTQVGITLYPHKTPVKARSENFFTLVFAPLPSDCKVFDLIEEIPEPGGFKIYGIRRNKSDVYRVDIV
mgnify:FL=1